MLAEPRARSTWTQLDFSKERIDALPSPAKRTYYRDGGKRGKSQLALAVTPSGKKSFYFIRWASGRTIFLRLEGGSYPEMTVEQARKAVDVLNGQVSRGEDPAAARHQADAEPTIRAAFQRWLETYKKPMKRSGDQDEGTWRRYLERQRWVGKKLSHVTSEEISLWHQRIGDRHGLYAANAALRLLRALLNWNITREKLSIPNPAAGIKTFAEEPRTRWVGSEAMPALLAAIDADQNPDMRDFFLLCLFTGARRGNVQAMRWEAIDLREATWTIPSAEHKTGKTLTVPLPTPALALLQARWATRTSSPYVFPSTGQTGHLVEPKAAWRRIVQRAGLEGLRIHDLRHSVASWMVNQGTPLTLIGAALGHARGETTQRYAHVHVDPVREASERCTAAMLATRAAPAVVVPIRAARGDA